MNGVCVVSRLDLFKEMKALGVEIAYNSIPHDWIDRDFHEAPLEVLSYGGGTQSTAMLLMIAQEKLPRPDLIIHADTGSELPETVEFIEVAKEYAELVLKIPFAIAKSHRGKLHEDYYRIGTIPIIGARSCTDNFKILPQRRLMRLIVGRRRGKVLARCWLGITTDEARRKPTHRDPRAPKWVDLWFPLLDHHPTSREECISMNSDHGWEVAKSGCFMCCYQGSSSWKRLKRDHPDLFQIAIELEERKFEKNGGKIGLFQTNRLRDLDDLDIEDSSCDSGAGCFL